MHQLAFIAVADSSGKKLKLPAGDISWVVEKSGGCKIRLRDGTDFDCQTAADDVLTAIDTLWNEYLTALGNP